MKARDLHRFFEELDRQLNCPIEVILTGGAAAILQGVERATFDIDFEVKLKAPKKGQGMGWEMVQRAIDDTARITGITPEYDEDIDRWSSITLPGKKSKVLQPT